MECELEGITLHYEVRGEGRLLLMLHGLPLDYRCLFGCMEPLFENRAGWKRIYVDLPGMGETKGVEWISTQDQMLNVVIGFIDQIIGTESFAIAGLSYGGYLAQGVVYKLPQMVDGVALIVPSVGAKESTLPAKVTLVPDAALMERMDPAEAAGFGFGSVVQNQRVYERWFNELELGYRMRDDNFLAQITEDRYSFDPNALAEPFQRPALILLGRQDHFVGYRDQWGIIENYPRATFAVLDRAGHMAYIEQEKLFNALVNEWLDRVEESAAMKQQAN